MVVIAIIAVLAGMLLAAVFKVLDVAYEAQTRTDITQLSGSVQAFQTQFKVPYIPSRIILCKNFLNYFNNQNPQQGYITPLHQDSVEYLSRVFPRITTPVAAGLPQWAITGIDWNLTGNVQDYPPAYSWSVYPVGNVPMVGAVLEGEQCLVFFLGGIPQYNGPNTPPTPIGFSTNPADPSRGSDRVSPFFDFKSNRLIYLSGTFNPAAVNQDPGYPSYLDGYGKTPYAYFSSYKNSNGYNRYVNYSNPNIPPGGIAVTTDCQALGVFPYIQAGLAAGPSALSAPVPQYLNAQTFQIISAGKNYFFGSGSVIGAYPPQIAGNPASAYPPGNQLWAGSPMWTPGTAAQLYPQGQAGHDDISNFYDRLLGVASQ
jgi:hypothetical protein